MPNFILGKNAKSYAGSTLTTDSTEAAFATAIAAATLADNIQDLDTNLQKDTVEISSRANAAGFKQKVATLKDGTITFTVLWKPADAFFELLKNAYLDDSEIFFAALDQLAATNGTQGVAGNWQVSNFSRKEPLSGALTVDVELIPSSQTGWYKKT